MLNMIKFLLKLYQRVVSPWLGWHCRYVPSCSEYTLRAIEYYGWGGLLMGVKRILRCHPWARGGYDPVKEDLWNGE